MAAAAAVVADAVGAVVEEWPASAAAEAGQAVAVALGHRWVVALDPVGADARAAGRWRGRVRGPT